ncbi:MAG: LLM class F420-dependent oxidoreductase [Actinomycetia bacterium]|nr:LLM class F420-dependent oxidoreductase [Actinomycetes bacterium]MCP5028694.1 LLM class F420-dependent oxidoreductase [Actinomycetes bacterium]
MKFGLAFASSVGTDPASALEIARVAEAVGFESVWGGEHVVMPTTIESRYPYTADGKVPATPETPIPDPLIWLSYVAAVAPTLRLGTCILILPQRNPLVLAKELATLDHLSGGRVELGIGVGWLQEEFDALGVPWEGRGKRNDEYVEALRTIWSGSHVEFHGEFVDFEPLTSTPQPAQGRDIPILVGGDTEVAMRRAARLADGYFPGESDPDRLGELIATVRTACEECDRDPESIEINAMFPHFADPAGGIDTMRQLGVGRIMVPAFAFAGDQGLDRLRHFGEAHVIPNAASV